MCRAAALAFLVSAAPAVAHAQKSGSVHKYLTRREALREVFPRAAQYARDTLRLGSAKMQAARKALHRELSGSTFPVTLCYDAGGAFVGYAVVSEEVGKYRPFTFMVGITPEFDTQKVVVMIYREDRGGEIRTPRFLYQYEGKTARDPIRIHRDITNISGATLSVRAMNAGVKKVLYLVTRHYRASPPPSTYKAQRSSSESGSP